MKNYDNFANQTALFERAGEALCEKLRHIPEQRVIRIKN